MIIAMLKNPLKGIQANRCKSDMPQRLPTVCNLVSATRLPSAFAAGVPLYFAKSGGGPQQIP